MRLEQIGSVLLDQASSQAQLHQALDDFIQICGEVGGILPDPAFDAWSGDSLLADGVAIAPQAAANCARDYQRAVIFMRGVNAAMAQCRLLFPGETLHILYAGCGPYATLLLPLLPLYRHDKLRICLLDKHQRSLDSVLGLLEHFQLTHHNIETVQGDACTYVHPNKLHLVISETMQKSLEQEPQFAVTAQLVPQLRTRGIFIPQKIEVRLGLLPKRLEQGEPSIQGLRAPPAHVGHREIGAVLSLTQENVTSLSRSASSQENEQQRQLPPVVLDIPALSDLDQYDAALFTRIQVYRRHWLEDHAAEITLPQRSTDLSPLRAGQSWEISYQLGSYPRFTFQTTPGRLAATVY